MTSRATSPARDDVNVETITNFEVWLPGKLLCTYLINRRFRWFFACKPVWLASLHMPKIGTLDPILKPWENFLISMATGCNFPIPFSRGHSLALRDCLCVIWLGSVKNPASRYRTNNQTNKRTANSNYSMIPCSPMVKKQIFWVEISPLKWVGSIWYFDVVGYSWVWILTAGAIWKYFCMYRQVGRSSQVP